MATFEGKNAVAVGIETNGGHSKAAILFNDGRFETIRLEDNPDLGGSEAGLDEAIRQVLSGLDGGFTRNVGLAVSGLIDSGSGSLVHSSAMRLDLSDEFLQTLEAKHNIKISLINDADAGAVSEFELGAGRGADNMFYATIGHGIGGALILGGTLWRGDSGFAGEIGNIAVNSEGTRLEEIASADNILRRTRNRIHQDSTSSLSKLKDEEIDINAIVRAAEEEDDFALLMLERTGTYVGIAIAAVINLLNIERIVIGGPLVDSTGFVLGAITRRVNEQAHAPSLKRTSIIPGKLGSEASAIGAAMVAART